MSSPCARKLLLADSKDDKGDAAAEEQGRGTRHAEYKVGNAQPHHSGDSKRDDDGSPSSNSIRRDGGEVSAGLSTAGTEEDVEKIDDELSWTLFDEILDQNAVPTICQQSECGSRLVGHKRDEIDV